MGKRRLLLVDADARSLRVLEVSLRKAGFLVATAANGREALDKAHSAHPDLILSDTDMPEMNGFELCREIKADPELARVPFVFLTGQSAIESKIRGLELGVDEYLIKPIYIKEILTRIRILLQKKQRTTIETRRDPNTRFAGTLHDMSVVDLIQTIEVSRKSGLIHFLSADGRQATIYFRNGAVIDAEAGHLQGAGAVYRLLTWSEGEFELLFRTVRRKDVIETTTPALLVEGMRRLDEWSRLLEQMPPLTSRFDVDVERLAERLADVPDELNRLLRLFDGRRSLLDIIDLAGVGDLECLELVSQLFFEELLRHVEGISGDSAAEVSPEPSLEGWLGRQIPVAGVLLPLDPAPEEVTPAAEVEWDASDTDAASERSRPSASALDEIASKGEKPGSPSGVAAPQAGREEAATGQVNHAGNGVSPGRLRLVGSHRPNPVGDVNPAMASARAAVAGSPVSFLEEALESAAPAGPALATGSDAMNSSPGQEAETGSESKAEASGTASTTAAAFQALPAAAAAAAAFSMAVSGTHQVDSIIEPDFGPGDIDDFDTSDVTPTPLPVPRPLGDERSNPRVKSSLGAEVASVSGELGAAVRPQPAETGEDGREVVAIRSRWPELHKDSRPDMSGATPQELRADLAGAVGPAGNGRLRSVEIDQELSAAAEIIEFDTVRRRAAGPERSLQENPASATSAPSDEQARSAPPRQSGRHRTSAIVRVVGGRVFARTFVVTVAAALLVGACFGLLFWWLGVRHAETEGAGSAVAPETALGTPRSPIASGAGEKAPVTSPSSMPANQAVVTALEPPTSPAAPASRSPASVSTSAAETYEQLYEEAKRARRHEDYDAALYYVVRALQQRQTAQAFTLQAEALLALGDPGRALPAAETAVSLRPRQAQAWYIKGRIHRALGQKESARKAFEAYLEIAPEGPRADKVIDYIQDM